MDDETVGRRKLLQLLGAAGTTVGIAGCSGGDGGDGSDGGGGSGGDGSDGGDGGGGTDGTESTTTPRQATSTDAVVFDTFEDGVLAENIDWEVTADDRSATVDIADRESPDGGSKVLRIVDGRDPGAGPQKGPRVAMQGGASFAPDPWTVTGQFYLDSYPDTGRDPTKTSISVSHVDFVPGGLDDGDELETMHLNHEGPSIGKEQSVSAPALQAETWYDYEITHDGEGLYTATRYELDGDGDRSDSAEISIQTEAPMANAPIEFYAEGGQGTRDEGGNEIAVEHSYVRWEPNS